MTQNQNPFKTIERRKKKPTKMNVLTDILKPNDASIVSHTIDKYKEKARITSSRLI